MRTNHQHSRPASEDVLDELLEEIAAKFERGEEVNVEAYLQEYPDQAEELQKLLPAMQVLKDVGRSSSKQKDSSVIADSAETTNGTLGDFRILREVGRGGMGVVYEAEQISLNRTVALKVLPFAATMDPRQLQRFKNESLAAAHLEHPNIVDVYGVGSERGVHYYAMRFIDGPTLAEIVQQLRELIQQDSDLPESIERFVDEANFPKGGSLPVEPTRTFAPWPGDGPDPRGETRARVEAALSTKKSTFGPAYFRSVAQLAMQVTEGLEQAHQEGIIHRDIKPSNLMLDSRGKVWVTDFGLAHIETSGTLTMTGDLIGTVRYMSPEQALAKKIPLDHRTDIYSLGVTLYELLTLRPAFAGDNRQELLRQIAEEEPKSPCKSNNAIAADLETIVLKAMRKEPAERYSSAQEMADDLRRFLQEKPVHAQRPTLVQRFGKWSRRNRGLVGAAAVCLLVAAVVFGATVGWFMHADAVRTKKAEDKIELIIRNASKFQKKRNWSQAMGEAKRAAGLLLPGHSETLTNRVQQLVADLEMVRRLEKIRTKVKSIPSGQFFNYSGTDQEYATAFREFGIDPGSLDVEAAATHLRSRSICFELTAALDDWAAVRRKRPSPDNEGWKRLIQVARAADPDPWRDRFRVALLKKDRKKLVELVQSAPIEEFPAATLYHFAATLHFTGHNNEAVLVLLKGYRRYPDDFWINFDLAHYLSVAKSANWTDAARFYQAAVSLEPHKVAGHNNLGIVLLKLNKTDEAIALFRKALKIDPNANRLWHNLGAALSQNNQEDEAVKVLRKAVKINRQYANGLYGLGRVLVKQKKWGEAVNAFRKAVEINPKDLSAWNNLGNALQKQNKFDKAVSAFREAIGINPKHPGSWNNLGFALQKQNKLDKAIEAYQKSISFDDNYKDPWNNLGNALAEQKKLDQAVEAYEKALKIDPDYHLPLVNIANTLTQQDNPDKAVRYVRRALEVAPKHKIPWCVLGMVLTAQNKPDEAIDAYRKAIEIDPQYAKAWYNLGNVLFCQDKVNDAIEAYRKAVKIDRQYAIAWNNLGVALEEANQLDEAIDAYRKTVKLDPTDALAWKNLGLALRTDGQFQEALEALRTCHELGLNMPNWNPPSARYVKECQSLVDLAKRLKRQKAGEKLLGEQILQGKLSKNDLPDRVRKRSYHRVHSILMKKGSLYRIELASPHFDTFLRVEDSQKKQLAANDDRSPLEHHSGLSFLPPKTARYRVIVTTYTGDETGRYFLAVQQLIPVGNTQPVQGKLTKESPLYKKAHYQVHLLKLRPERAYVVDLEGKDFDPMLLVKNSKGKIVLRNDDGGEGQNARLILNSEVETVVELLAAAVEPEAIGRYTLRIQEYGIPAQEKAQAEEPAGK